MKTPTRPKPARKSVRSAAPAAKAGRVASEKKRAKRSKDAAVNAAIATELAPAAAIAVLEKTNRSSDAPAPALDILGAGVSPADDDDKVRVQLVFESGAVLPVEMSVDAGQALASGLSKELPAKK